jgi:crotonobetainyl-CoA:carnitine CoA-transferase CaiB-like acyl-CoA transferase
LSQALEGYRIIDFTHVLAGPIATNYLRLQGADVVKVESSIGDTMRNYGGKPAKDGMGPSFVSVNAGKRSIVLDLKNEADLEVARRLVATADVVVENFRPGVMDRLGLGYQACREISPLKANPAVDQIIQSMSGLMNLSGEPGSPPVRVGFPVVDTFSGLLAALAIVTALLQRERTGEGQFIDVAMFDAAMVMMVSMLGPYLVSGVKPAKQGNRGYSMAPTADTFATADGDITIGAIRDDQYALLCRVIQRPDLVTDPRFADRGARLRNSVALQAEVTRAFSTRSALEWEQLLNQGGVAAGAVRDLSDAIALSHFDGRGLKIPLQIPGLARETVEVLNAGFIFAHDPPGIDRPPPRLGEHTKEILAELGYPQEDIETFCSRPRTTLRQETK